MYRHFNLLKKSIHFYIIGRKKILFPQSTVEKILGKISALFISLCSFQNCSCVFFVAVVVALFTQKEKL